MAKYGITEKRLQLLRDVSGAFRPGVLTALMGITGAGKTTLLDVLAGRKTGGYIDGTISIAGYPKKQETFSRVSGYCEQTDVHSPFVTVYESLQYSAWLRLPSNVGLHERNVSFLDQHVFFFFGFFFFNFFFIFILPSFPLSFHYLSGFTILVHVYICCNLGR